MIGSLPPLRIAPRLPQALQMNRGYSVPLPIRGCSPFGTLATPTGGCVFGYVPLDACLNPPTRPFGFALAWQSELLQPLLYYLHVLLNLL